MEAILKKELVINKNFCRTTAVIISVLLISLGAFMRIPLPFTPVPITMQTFFVLFCAAMLGARLGTLVQVIYVILGISGFSLFTGAGSSSLYLFGPTGGYLAGFIFSAIFIAKAVKFCKNNPFLLFAVFSVASFMILGFGTLWLKILLGVSVKKALFLGFAPFVAGDLCKAWAASYLYSKTGSRIKEII